MANDHHVSLLRKGPEAWNKWRIETHLFHPNRATPGNLLPPIDLAAFSPDLSGADLRRLNLQKASLTFANLSGADLSGSDLSWADLTMASLVGANFTGARLSRVVIVQADASFAQFREARMVGAFFKNTNLNKANFDDANLRFATIHDANLEGASFLGTDLRNLSIVQTTVEHARFLNCRVYGISAWDLSGTPKEQSGLRVTPDDLPTITVDNIEVAQFIYLLLFNEKIRNMISTVTSKVVLILGRFTPEWKAVLDSLRIELKRHDYVPVVCDFEKPLSRTLGETVLTLAHLSRFIVVDITSPRSVPQELASIVPNLPSVPVQPLVHGSAVPYAMFEALTQYPWVLKPVRYDSVQGLALAVREKIIMPCEARIRGETDKARIRGSD